MMTGIRRSRRGRSGICCIAIARSESGQGQTENELAGGADLLPVNPQVRTSPGSLANIRLCARNDIHSLEQHGRRGELLRPSRAMAGVNLFCDVPRALDETFCDRAQ